MPSPLAAPGFDLWEDKLSQTSIQENTVSRLGLRKLDISLFQIVSPIIVNCNARNKWKRIWMKRKVVMLRIEAETGKVITLVNGKVILKNSSGLKVWWTLEILQRKMSNLNNEIVFKIKQPRKSMALTTTLRKNCLITHRRRHNHSGQTHDEQPPHAPSDGIHNSHPTH